MPKTRYTLATDESMAKMYRERFIEFSKAELATGGPDQHLRIIGELGKRDEYDASWLVGAYMAPYNVPGGLAIIDSWPNATYAYDAADLDDLASWFKTNWPGFPVRKERRPCRSPYKMAEYLNSYARWSIDVLPKIADANYETLWKSLDDVKYVGRYAGMKMLESLRRTGVIKAKMPDIRAGKGGDWSPRLALSYLYPEYDELLNRDHSSEAGIEINVFAEFVYPEFAQSAGIPDMYTFEVLLCDFKQHLEGKYPPGKPLNSEWNHIQKVKSWPGFASVNTDVIIELRRELFPHEYLFEVSGWVPDESD